MNTQTLDSLKIDLIVQITKSDDEAALRRIKEVFSKSNNQETTEKQREMLKKVAKPTRKKIDIKQLKREQNWKPINRQEFDKLVKEIDIQEPLEQLIADIGR